MIYKLSYNPYIGCCQVFVTKDLKRVQIEKTGDLLTCKASVQAALRNPTSLFDVKISDSNVLFRLINAFGTLCLQIHKLGQLCGFVHNDAHLGNLQLWGNNQISFIDLGRVALDETLVEKVVEKVVRKELITTTVIADVVESTMKNADLFYRDNIRSKICDNKKYIPASPASFIFDISTIVLGLLQSFSQNTMLEFYIKNFNKRLSEYFINQKFKPPIDFPTSCPKLEFEFVNPINIGGSQFNIQINQIKMSTIQTLYEISKVMSVGAKNQNSFFKFDRYVIAGLLVFAYISKQNGAVINQQPYILIQFDLLVKNKIMWNFYQYTRPVTIDVCKEVGWLCHCVLSPGKNEYPKLKNLLRAGGKRHGGIAIAEKPGDLDEILKSKPSSEGTQDSMDLPYLVALANGQKTPPRPLSGSIAPLNQPRDLFIYSETFNPNVFPKFNDLPDDEMTIETFSSYS